MAEESSYQRGDKFLRIVEIFDKLQGTHAGWTPQELADKFGVTVRSVQRYLKVMGEVLDIVKDDQGRYRIGDKSQLPPMQFTKQEGAALLVAVRLLQQMRTTRDPALTGAVGRLAQAMKINTITAYLGTMVEDAEERDEDGAREQIEKVLVECFVDRIPCEIEYENADGGISKRVIRTYFLEPRQESRTLYVYALDAKSTSMRLFRMDRIRQARKVPIEGRYSVPEDFDIAEVTRSSWGVWQAGEELHEVVLRFEASIAPRVRQSVWHPSAALSELPGGGVELRLRVASEIEMRPWVLGWGSLVEVLEPASLREHVAESMRQGAQMYDGQLSPG